MTRKFGVELEVATSKPAIEILKPLQEAGINIERSHYGSSTKSFWKLHKDGSVNGWEIVSPPLTDTKDLEIVCHVLRKVCKVRSSKKTGLHIHHDVSDFTLPQLQNIYKLFFKYENNAIHSITSPNRFNNIYCENIVPRHMKYILEAKDLEDFTHAIHTRYVTLNNKSYVKYGTIEFRGAQGTVEIDRVLSWIELTNRLVETAKTGEFEYDLENPRNLKPKEEALEDLFNELDMNEFSRKHYRKVQRFFAKHA